MSPTSRLLVSLSHSADMNLLGLGGMTLDTRCTPVPLTLQFPPLVLCRADAESPAISDNSGVGVAYMLPPHIKVYKIMISAFQQSSFNLLSTLAGLPSSISEPNFLNRYLSTASTSTSPLSIVQHVDHN